MKNLWRIVCTVFLASLITASCATVRDLVPFEQEVEPVENVARATSLFTSSALSMSGYADAGPLVPDSETFPAESLPGPVRSLMGFPEVEGPDGNGVFTVHVSPDIFYIRWLTEDEVPIVKDESNDPWENLIATVRSAQKVAKYFHVRGDFRELDAPEHAPEIWDVRVIRNEPEFVFEFNVIGDIALVNDGIANGQWYSGFDEGGYADYHFIDVEVEGVPINDKGIKWRAIGGTAKGEVVLEEGSHTYATEVTFIEDGTGEGTLTQIGEDYLAKFMVDTWRGGGYYEDDTGKYHF